MLKQLLKRKNISQITLEADDEQHGLKRVLGPLDLVSLGIGIIIGAGIFVVTGQAAAQYAGPAISVSFVLSGFGCVLAGLCYAEMASMIPVSGSAYTYAYATLGQFIAWVIGWDLVLEYLFASSTVSVGWSGYVVSFLKDFGIFIPDIVSRAPL
ncbi:MAG: amino acid permease, partial [Candidatus Dadabacteria bacterium]|nr:amino acid permease [Candidatus Dadabacteria bacterium]